MEIPVYLFAGFLEAGKTTFINGILEDGFAREDKTLLICCEEGVEEYDTKALDNVTVVTVEEEEELNEKFLKSCEKKYRPHQVLIEYNGMWQLDRLYREVLPDNWVLYQIMTMIKASTFDVYAKNLGQMMMEKLTNADMIVFNRCDEGLRASLRKRNLRMVNRRANIFLENVDGTSEDYLTGDECPFDLDVDVINVPDDDYGVWYVDAMEHPQRYEGKKVHFKAVMCYVPQYPGVAVPGRFAMVCCENDVSFLGMVARGEKGQGYENRQWVELTVQMAVEQHEAYGEEPGPVMHILSSAPCEGPERDVVTF